MAHNQFDISLKDLVDDYAQSWAKLAGGQSNCNVKVINAEISTLEARADKVIRVTEPNRIRWLLNLELQGSHNKKLARGLHYKSVALSRKHNVLVRSLVILLRRGAKASNLSGTLEYKFANEEPYDVFRYQIIRLWERPLRDLLDGDTGLLPLAPLTDEAAPKLAAVLREIDERLKREVSLEQAEKLRVSTLILMGMRYKTEFVKQLAEGIMKMTLERSSVIQDALARGKAAGKAEGKAELLVRLGTKKFGTPSGDVLARIAAVSDMEQLEAMGERVLVATSWEEILS